MFSPIIIEYEVKEEEWEKEQSSLVKELHEKARNEPIVSNIGEFKTIVNEIEGYVFIFVYESVKESDLKEILEFESHSNIEGVFVGRIKNSFIFLGENKDKCLIESLHECTIKSIGAELNLTTERLKSWIYFYKNILEEIEEGIENTKKGKTPKIDSLEKLINKNKIVLPFLTENEKRIEKLKRFAEKENLNGVFNSILMNVNEEEIATLKTWTKVSLDYENLLMQHQTQQMTEKGIKEMVSLEKAIEYLYLFVGTYYVTELILLLSESYPSHYPILFTLPLFWFNVSVIVFSFLFSYFVLNYLSKTINWIKKKK